MEMANATSTSTSLLDEVFGDLNLDAFVNISPVTQFPQFSNIPKEIRIQIFVFGASEARTVQIEVDDGYATGSHTPSPITLRINQESRHEALQILRKLVPVDADGKEGAPIYYHPENDTIYFHGRPGPQNKFFSRGRVPLFREPRAILELGYITKLRFEHAKMSRFLLFWFLLFPRREEDHVVQNYRSIEPFTGVKIIQISTTELFQDLFMPPDPMSPQETEAFQATVFRTLFKLFAPKAYDATNKTVIEVSGHGGSCVARFWEDSYDLNVQGAVGEVDGSEEDAVEEEDKTQPEDVTDEGDGAKQEHIVEDDGAQKGNAVEDGETRLEDIAEEGDGAEQEDAVEDDGAQQGV